MEMCNNVKIRTAQRLGSECLSPAAAAIVVLFHWGNVTRVTKPTPADQTGAYAACL